MGQVTTEETVIKSKRQGDVEIPVSTPELCMFCGVWLPLDDHLAHDLELHMPKMPMCLSATRRTYTRAEKEYLGGEKRAI